MRCDAISSIATPSTVYIYKYSCPAAESLTLLAADKLDISTQRCKAYPHNYVKIQQQAPIALLSPLLGPRLAFYVEVLRNTLWYIFLPSGARVRAP